MARKRPIASDVPQIPANPDAAARAERVGLDDAGHGLTQAQAHALRRCAPLSSSEFNGQRQVLAQQHGRSIMRIRRHGLGDDNAVVGRQPSRMATDVVAPSVGGVGGESDGG